MRKLLILFLFFVGLHLHAQDWDFRYNYHFNDSTRIQKLNWHIGFKAGINLSKISTFQSTIINEIYDHTTYKTKTPLRTGVSIGIFGHWKSNYNNWGTAYAIQPEFVYTQQGSLFSYEDTNKFTYNMKMRYNYISICSAIKLYIWDGLHLSLIPQLELVTNPNAIIYSSNFNEVNEEIQNVDQQIQSNLREVLKAENHFSLGLGIGYEYNFGNGCSIITELRHQRGVMDMIETLSNTFYMEENPNDRSRFFQFTIGIAFPL